ncbi:AMP-binding protein [Nocardioides sambongensis]|uniref:AMP-binding protein n=1 Tax=Nocardioides sambongensis TaxID=2589074 RepID=UPI00112E5BAC|nr:AMP-binding protein [Nocardioides sambongensis]
MFDNRPWLDSYSDRVPGDIEIPDTTLDQLLPRAADRWGARPAVDFLGETTSYAALAADVERAAAALVELGVREGDAVSLVMPNCTSHVVAFHAVLTVGAIVVEHNPTYATEELREQFELAGSSVALVWRNRVTDVRTAGEGVLRHVVSVDVAEDLPLKSRLLLRLPIAAAREKRDALTGADEGGTARWSALLRDVHPEQLEHGRGPDDTALILFTGGTTGVPKAAAITHRNLIANAVHGRAWAGFAEGDEVVFGMLPFFHAFGMIFCLVLPATIGATLVAFPNFDPAAVVAAQRRRPATFLPGVAPMFGRILDRAEAERRPVDFGSVTLAFSGAMPLGREVAERWERLTGGLLIEGYGMTEASPIALGNPCSELRRPGTLGLPFPNTEIRVVDDATGTDAAPREDGVVRGELWVRGPQVFAGYVGRPDETAIVLEDGWLRTGDVVEVDPAGFATLVDRVKEMIVVGGFKVFPSVVEDHLRTLDAVEDVAVVGVPRAQESDEEVLAVVVLSEGASAPTLAELRAFAHERLPGYAVPRRLDVVEELPRSMIGKVLRRVARDEYLARVGDES